MKKVVSGWILLLVGAFLLTLAILLVTIGPGLTQRTPLNVDTLTHLSGSAKKLNLTSGQVEDVAVKVLNKTQVDPKKSDGKVIVFVSTSCANIDRNNPPDCLPGTDDRVISNSIDTFAADRHTGVAVNDPKYIGKATPHEGLVNKFPFNTEKKTYQYWDGTLGKAVPVRYVGTENVQDLSTYKFRLDIPTTNADIAKGTPGTYANKSVFWVEPVTGAIVNETQHQVLTLADGSPVLDLSIAFTPSTVSSGVTDAHSNISTLKLSGTIAPIVGFVLGILALIGGFLLVRAGRSDNDDQPQPQPAEPVTA